MTEYSVDFTDINKGFLTVDEKSANNETSLTLVGKNFTDYGEIFNENFLHLLENFANNTSPSNPVEGQLWYDTTDGVDQLKLYDGTKWIPAGGLKKSSSTPEANVSSIGDLWVDTTSQQLYLYTGSSWILVGPEYAIGANTGAKFETLVSTTNQNNNVIINYIDNIPVAIVSATSFTPKLTIPGYTTINPGVTLNSNISGSVGKVYGTSEKAENLLVGGTTYPGTEFARLNATNIFSKPIRIQNNNGVNIGETETFIVSVSASNALLTNKSTDGYIALRVNNSNTAIRITNLGRVGILNENPQQALDVNGNILTNGTITTTSTATNALSIAGSAEILQNLDIGGNIDVNGSITVGNIIPSGTNLSIGSSTLSYNNIYANNFYGTFRGELIGNITGSAGSAARLNSSTNFSITGDVETIIGGTVNFDGTGGTKTFSVEIVDTFITTKTAYTDTISGDEEILIYNPQEVPNNPLDQPPGVYKTTVSDILSTIPIFEVGMIMPYAGSTEPTGWIFCDGRTLNRLGTYEPLFLKIGTAYGAPSSTTFKIPDARGRFLLGFLNSTSRVSAGDEDRIYDDPAGNIRGGTGGGQRRWLTEDQLPEHRHSLQGSAGTQFYAVTNVLGGSDDNIDSLNITGSTPGTGLRITESVEGLTTTTETIPGYGSPQEVGNKFTTVPPFQTVNYIIYTGV